MAGQQILFRISQLGDLDRREHHGIAARHGDIRPHLSGVRLADSEKELPLVPVAGIDRDRLRLIFRHLPSIFTVSVNSAAQFPFPFIGDRHPEAAVLIGFERFRRIDLNVFSNRFQLKHFVEFSKLEVHQFGGPVRREPFRPVVQPVIRDHAGIRSRLAAEIQVHSLSHTGQDETEQYRQHQYDFFHVFSFYFTVRIYFTSGYIITEKRNLARYDFQNFLLFF